MRPGSAAARASELVRLTPGVALTPLPGAVCTWAARDRAWGRPEERPVRHRFAIETICRQPAGGARGVRSGAGDGLLRITHAGRYFGGLWFKVFSERGPC
jgi:hypothetical protein